MSENSKTTIIALAGSVNAELDPHKRVINFSEYGEHVFRLSYE